MKYKQIYSEARNVPSSGYRAQCVDVFFPDYSDFIPQGAPALIRFATQVNEKLENILWEMVEANSEAHVIRQAIKEFDAMEVK